MRAAACALAMLLAACMPPALQRPTQSLRMRLSAGPPDATVYVDDELLGQLDYVVAHGVALPKGKHYVTVKASGYLPYDKEVESRPSDREGERVAPLVLDVQLVPIPD